MKKTDNKQNLRGAVEYEKYTSVFLKPWDDLFIQSCVALNPIAGGNGILLDVGTGTAVLPEKLSVEPGFEKYTFIGIDYYDYNVIEANKKLAKRELSNRIQVFEGDAQALNFADDYFDMVLSRATLHHLVNPTKALQEKFRVLKKGGKCIIHDMRKDVSPEVLAIFNGMRANAGYPPTVVGEKFTINEIEGFIAAAGLSQYTKINYAELGFESLGYEIIIKK